MQTSTLLHCTPSERSLFDALPEALREGWKLKDETLSYQDSPKNREIRFMIARFHDPKLLEVRAKFTSVKTDEDFMALAASIDLSALSETDLGQILFALGPDAIGSLILAIFRTADSDEDLLMISHLSEARHELLQSLTIVS